MGAHHSNDKSLPSFEYENKNRFPYDDKCPFEDKVQQTLPSDLSCIAVNIPCAGSACPDLSVFKSSWISGCPNPDSVDFQRKPSKIHGILDEKFVLPHFGPSGQYSLILLTSKFTKNHLINTSEVETCLNRLFDLYQNEIDQGTFPSFIDALPGPARFSASYQRLHVLMLRLIYHQIMAKNKLLYYGSSEAAFLTLEGVEYALIQHPNFHSELLRFQKLNIFAFYPVSFLHSLKIKSYELYLLPLNLVRSAFSFHRYPAQALLKSDNRVSTKATMPLSLLYLDCVSATSVHTLNSFILHHILASNTGLTVYNTDATIVVVMLNSSLLVRGIFIDENAVLDVFEKYLSITPRIYLAPSCPSVQQSSGPSTRFLPITHYFKTPCDITVDIPPVETETETNFAFSNEDFQRSCDEWLQVLNSALLQALIPFLLKCLKLEHTPASFQPPANDLAPTLQNLTYINSIPLFNPSKLHSILPLAQSAHPELIRRFQWHNLKRSRVQYIELSMFTFCVKNVLLSGRNLDKEFRCESHYQIPFINAMRSIDLSRRDVTVSAEYIVDIQTSHSCHSNLYSPIQSIKNDTCHIINTSSLQSSHLHVKMFAPLESPFEQTKVLEQTIVDQLDEDYRYSLISSPITLFTGSDEASSGTNTHDRDNYPQYDHEQTTDDHFMCSTQNVNDNSITEPIVLIESQDRPLFYTFNYRGEHESRLNKPYTASINYFSSHNEDNNEDIEIKIISPDFHHPTKGDRINSLPMPLPVDVSTAYCALPINQILAIDTHLTKMVPSAKPAKTRYLIQLRNHFRRQSFSTIIPLLYSYLCPAICITSFYDASSPCLTPDCASQQFFSCRQALLQLNINIPLIFVTILPEDFDIQLYPIPYVAKHTNLLYGWDFEYPLHYLGKQNSNDDNQTFRSQDDIEFHCNLILQRMKHIARYLTQLPDIPFLDVSKYTQRSVYYFVVKGLAGYFECLPRINQCALAHFFSYVPIKNGIQVFEFEYVFEKTSPLVRKL